jgi:hypothetical protein
MARIRAVTDLKEAAFDADLETISKFNIVMPEPFKLALDKA